MDEINIQYAVEFLLREKYLIEFVEVCGMSQHKNDWTYDEWLERNHLVPPTENK